RRRSSFQAGSSRASPVTAASAARARSSSSTRIGSPSTTATVSSSWRTSGSLQASRRIAAPRAAITVQVPVFMGRPPRAGGSLRPDGLCGRLSDGRRRSVVEGEDLHRLLAHLQLFQDGLVDLRVGPIPELLDEFLEGLGLLLPLQAALDLGANLLEGTLDALLPTEELDDVETLVGDHQVGKLPHRLEGEGGVGELLPPHLLQLVAGAEGEVAAGPLGAFVVGALPGKLGKGIPVLAAKLGEGALGLGPDAVAGGIALGGGEEDVAEPHPLRFHEIVDVGLVVGAGVLLGDADLEVVELLLGQLLHHDAAHGLQDLGILVEPAALRL